MCSVAEISRKRTGDRKMANRDLIKNHVQLRQLTELLQWANTSDSDEATDRSSKLADQRNFYGDISDAIYHLVKEDTGIDIRTQCPDPNYGGNASWYEDLLNALDCAEELPKEVTLGNFEVVEGTEGPKGDPYGFTEVTVWLSEQESVKAHCGLGLYIHHTLNGELTNQNFNIFEDFDKRFIELTKVSFDCCVEQHEENWEEDPMEISVDFV